MNHTFNLPRTIAFVLSSFAVFPAMGLLLQQRSLPQLHLCGAHFVWVQAQCVYVDGSPHTTFSDAFPARLEMVKTILLYWE